MQQKLQRYATIVRIVGIAILAVLLFFVGYQVYDFYKDRVGFTPVKAIDAYFQALAGGQYEQVYELTAKDRLSDIYGRPITKAEFMEQLEQVTGQHRMPFTLIESEKLTERNDAHYYLVSLTSSVGGSAGKSYLTIEVRREDGAWVVTYPFAIVL